MSVTYLDKIGRGTEIPERRVSIYLVSWVTSAHRCTNIAYVLLLQLTLRTSPSHSFEPWELIADIVEHLFINEQQLR